MDVTVIKLGVKTHNLKVYIIYIFFICIHKKKLFGLKVNSSFALEM